MGAGIGGLVAAAWDLTALRIGLFFVAAWVVHRVAGRLARRLVRLWNLSPRLRAQRAERRETLAGVLASTISFGAFVLALLASAGQFVDPEALVWMVGLFSAAFGLGARPIISDFLTGLSLIFEDTFAVGEKVEVAGIEGVIEAVNVRTTLLRAPTGELWIIPNGEVRQVRNFSRGRFSTANVRIKVDAAHLADALTALEPLGLEAVSLLPDLLEPWQVISESGVLGQQTELTLVAKARFGRAADLRPRLLTLVLERLAEAGVGLVD